MISDCRLRIAELELTPAALVFQSAFRSLQSEFGSDGWPAPALLKLGAKWVRVTKRFSIGRGHFGQFTGAII